MLAAKEPAYMWLKVMPSAKFQFTREGEVPAPLSIKVPASACEGLGMNINVKVSGVGAVGSHPWEKREFGKTKSKDITNYYFEADKVEQVKV